MRAALEKLLTGGRDDALLRFSLGGACLKDGDLEAAVRHLRRAVDFDPGYSAAWKLLGQALKAANRETEAAEAWERGIAAAGARGDVQAGKEMGVYLKRLRRQTGKAD